MKGVTAAFTAVAANPARKSFFPYTPPPREHILSIPAFADGNIKDGNGGRRLILFAQATDAATALIFPQTASIPHCYRTRA